MNSYTKNIGILISAFVFGACTGEAFSPGEDGGVDQSIWPNIEGGGGPVRPSCPGQHSVLQGTVFAPNGTDPVPGASVFIPSKIPELFSHTVKCEVCGQMGGKQNTYETTSGWNGGWSLPGVCPGTYNLVFQNGRFRRLVKITVPAKQTIKVPRDKTRLPRRNKEFNIHDAIPRIAVATGDYDKMECVLRKMGLQDGSYDLYDGAKVLKTSPKKPAFSTLVTNLNKMKTFNIIFINCTDNTYETSLKNSQVLSNLDQYVRSGGRLYVTDWSYDWVEAISAFAPFIDFEPGASGASPEPRNAAALGANGLKVYADIKDNLMAKWMGLFSGAIQNGKALIQHFLVDWVIMHSVHKDTKTWIDGVIKSKNGSINARRPLTVTFNFKNCGKILFSSYHTEGRDDEFKTYPAKGKPFPQYCGPTFSPQDRILEYLIFDIANCLPPVK